MLKLVLYLILKINCHESLRRKSQRIQRVLWWTRLLSGSAQVVTKPSLPPNIRDFRSHFFKQTEECHSILASGLEFTAIRRNWSTGKEWYWKKIVACWKLDWRTA